MNTITTPKTVHGPLGAYRDARNKVIGEEAIPASTLLIVAGLASPEMLIEVEAWAAKG